MLLSNKYPVIAIDGPAASGKSTIAERLGRKIGYLFFDTGIMYRAVTLAALNELHGIDDEAAVTSLAERVHIDVCPPSKKDGRSTDVFLDGKDVTWEIRTAAVDLNVSKVSAYQGVRIAMTDQQRRIGRQGKVIMVGRDIGTVVFPHAMYKFYLDASPEERARRRHKEIVSRGDNGDFESILASILRRDKIDSTRQHAPLKPAEDAIIIDTDGKTIEEVLHEVLSYLPSEMQSVETT